MNYKRKKREQVNLPKDGSSFGKLKATINRFDHDRVKELADALQCCGRILRPINAELWRSLFGNLRRKVSDHDRIAKDRIRKTLHWYIKHIRQEGLPTVRSAQSFTRSFYEIERQSKIAGTPSTTAFKIVDKLTASREWPRDTGMELPSTVQLSIDAYNRFLQKLEAVALQLKDDYVNQTQPCMDLQPLVCVERIQRALPPTVTFVTQYMESLHQMVWGWSSWSGTLRGLDFQPESPKFCSRVRSILNSYTSDTTLCLKILELLEIDPDGN